MQGMERNEDYDAMYANGHPDVSFDQDASVHLKDVRSHIAALKVYTHACSASPVSGAHELKEKCTKTQEKGGSQHCVHWPDLEPWR